MRAIASVNGQTGEVGSLYVQFTTAPIVKTVPVKNPDDPDILIDLDGQNDVVGVEVLNLSLLRAICTSIKRRIPEPYKEQVSELCPA